MLLNGRQKRGNRRQERRRRDERGRRLGGHGPASQRGRLRRRNRDVPAARRREGQPFLLFARHGALRPRHGAQDGPAALHAQPQGALRQARHAGLRRLLQTKARRRTPASLATPTSSSTLRRSSRTSSGIHHVATGHYARVEEGPTLARPVDESKDQTYVLWPVPAGAPCAYDLPPRRVSEDRGARHRRGAGSRRRLHPGEPGYLLYP